MNCSASEPAPNLVAASLNLDLCVVDVTKTPHHYSGEPINETELAMMELLFMHRMSLFIVGQKR